MEREIPGYTDLLYRRFLGVQKDIEVYDILSNKIHLMKDWDLIRSIDESEDFILSVPHAGLLVPEHLKK